MNLKGRYEGMSERWCIAEMTKCKIEVQRTVYRQRGKTSTTTQQRTHFSQGGGGVAIGTAKERSLGDETPPEEGEDVEGGGDALICSRRRGRE